MANFFKAVWEFLNGKKMFIGVAFIGIGYLGQYLGWSSEVTDALIRIGELLGGLGVIHKFYKGGYKAGVNACEIGEEKK